MKKDKYYKKGSGIRTFLLYSIIVLLMIFFSICAKAIFVIKNSKFDGKNLNLAISQNNKIVGILGFNTTANTISFLKIKKGDISSNSVGQELGIIPDTRVDSNQNLTDEGISSILLKSAVKSDSIKTNLTIFDILRLIIFSKNVSENNYKDKVVEFSSNTFDDDKIISGLFKNDSIVSENLSIQVVNATERSGLGNRLERTLSNIGAQVISVSTSREQKSKSVIQYSGYNRYTVSKLNMLLNVPIQKLKVKSIADIIIIIGEDMQNTSVF